MKVSDFSVDWKSVRGKTYEFLETVPEEKIMWRPHKDLGTFGMQIRHMGVSQKAYINGIKNGRIDYENKVYNKDIEKSKKKAITFLKDMDKELIDVLKSADKNKEIEFHDGVYGFKKVSLGTVLEWLLQHEAYHQGVFTCYGRLAGLGKFRLM